MKLNKRVSKQQCRSGTPSWFPLPPISLVDPKPPVPQQTPGPLASPRPQVHPILPGPPKHPQIKLLSRKTYFLKNCYQISDNGTLSDIRDIFKDTFAVFFNIPFFNTVQIFTQFPIFISLT